MYLTKTWFRVLSPLVYGTSLHLFILIIPNSLDFLADDYTIKDTCWMVLLMLLFLESNLSITLFLEKKENLNHLNRILIQTSVSILIAVILAYILSNYEFHSIIKNLVSDEINVPIANILNAIHLRIFILFVVMALVHHLVFFTVRFLKLNREKALEAENLRKETVINQLNILKNQIQPEFWFTSLERLIDLVHENPQQAETFIKKLSLFYRYTLNHNTEDLVSLEEELTFLEIYLYLVNTQKEQKIILSKISDIGTLQKLVPFGVLQKLIEDLGKLKKEFIENISLIFQFGSDELEMCFCVQNQSIQLDKKQFKSILELNQVLSYYTDKKITIHSEKILIPLLELSTNFE